MKSDFGVLLAFSAILLSVTSTPVLAGLKAVTAYEPWKLGRPGGYTEKIKSPTRWIVKGTSTSSTIGGFALAMAFHRAAIRAKALGYSHFYTAKLDITNAQFCRGCSYGNQTVYLTAVATNDPQAQIACEAKGRMAENCGIHVVSEKLTQYGQILGRTEQMQDDEIKAVKATLGTS